MPSPGNEAIDAAIDRGVSFLLEDQNENGSWGSATQTKGLNIYAPIPGAHRAFRAAVTANCLAALLETKAVERNPDAAEAAGRAEEWLLKYLPKVRRATGDAIYNVWAHAYGARTLALMLRREKDPERQKQIREAIEFQYDLLTRYESVDGGWGYYDFRYQTAKPSSSSIGFTSATALLAFHEARKAGVPPPQKIVDRAVAAIQRQRKPDNSYAYGEYLKMSPMRGINLPAGSLGRSQACNLALRQWGDSTITNEVLDHLARPALGTQRLARHRQEETHPSRILDAGRRILLLLRTLLRRPLHRGTPSGGRRGPSRSSGNGAPQATGKERFLVGLPLLQLPSAIRHRLRTHVAVKVPPVVSCLSK